MTTPIFITGFENGVATLTTNGGGLWDTVSGTALSVQNTIKRTGSYALRINPSATTSYTGKTITGSPTTVVFSCYMYFTTIPNIDCELIRIDVASGWNHTFTVHQGKFAVYNGSFTDGSTINTGEWYLVEMRGNSSANPNTTEWRINGTPQTTINTSQAATTISGIRLGTMTSTTGDWYYDDLVVSATSGDYPIGSEAICLIKPDADGTHDNAANCIEDNDGNDVGAVTAYDHINSTPPDASVYLRVGTASAGKYGETTLSNMTAGGVPIGAMGYICYTSATTTANNAGAVIMDSTNEREIWGKTGTYQDYSDGSTSNLYYKSAIITVASISEANVNALKFRFISGDDANPDPYLIDAWAEIAYSISTTKAPPPFQKRTPYAWRKKL